MGWTYTRGPLGVFELEIVVGRKLRWARRGPLARAVYMDPETFSFVRQECRLESPSNQGSDPETFRFDVVSEYLTFESLPRTEDILALTDIRAQHPNATGSR